MGGEFFGTAGPAFTLIGSGRGVLSGGSGAREGFMLTTAFSERRLCSHSRNRSRVSEKGIRNLLSLRPKSPASVRGVQASIPMISPPSNTIIVPMAFRFGYRRS